MIEIVNKKYNDMLYDSRPVKFSDFMNNKYNIVHKKIYENAIDSYINDWLYIKNLLNINKTLENELKEADNYKSIKEIQNKINHNKSYLNLHSSDKKYIIGERYFDVNNIDEFKENSFIYEIPNNEYWQPSKCVIITKFLHIKSPSLRWKVDLTNYWNYYQQKKEKDIQNLKVDINENINDSEIIGLNYITGKAKLYSENLDKTFEVDFDYLDGENNRINEDFTLSKSLSTKL